MEPIPVALGYYELYSNLEAGSDEGSFIVAKVATPSRANTTDDGDSENDNNSDEYSPWVPDEWTEADTDAAVATLAQHEARCRISSSNSTYDPAPAAATAWNDFYQHHTTHFFRDRHYLRTTFPDEFGPATGTLVEIGCGVGNTLLPVLSDRPGWSVHGSDVSPMAIALVQQDPRWDSTRAYASVGDIAEGPPATIRSSSSPSALATVTTLLFCLSAIPPDRHAKAIRHAVVTLRIGGVLVIRDYGRHDEAQLSLGRQRGKQLGPHWYRKQDGTACYYFEPDELRGLVQESWGDGDCSRLDNDNSDSTSGRSDATRRLVDVQMEELECRYLRRVYTNRSTGATRRRVWVQARFRRVGSGHSVDTGA